MEENYEASKGEMKGVCNYRIQKRATIDRTEELSSVMHCRW